MFLCVFMSVCLFIRASVSECVCSCKCLCLYIGLCVFCFRACVFVGFLCMFVLPGVLFVEIGVTL